MRRFREGLIDVVASVTTAVILITVMFSFCVRLVGVKGESMMPTLQDGNWLVVSSYNQSFQYGDIVIITQPNSLDEPIVKRVIATEGQYVDVRYSEGAVYVGNSPDYMMKLDEAYTASATDVHYVDDNHTYPVRVPRGSLFVMGDNRNHSTDSRSDLVGFIDKRYVLGKAVVRLLPIGDFSIYD